MSARRIPTVEPRLQLVVDVRKRLGASLERLILDYPKSLEERIRVFRF